MCNQNRLIGLIFFVLFGVFVSSPSLGQMKVDIPVRLRWNGVGAQRYGSDTLLYINLDSGIYEGTMPIYCQSFPIYDDAVSVALSCSEVKAELLSAEEMEIVKDHFYPDDFEMIALPLRARDEALLSLRIVPFRLKDGCYEKLLSANISVTLTPDMTRQETAHIHTNRSAMASGDWFKIGLSETGIYKLTSSDLAEMGINVSSINPRQIRVYHNGGGVLPEMNHSSRPDDLVEVPIFVSGESDGKFDNDDYILFYGRGPMVWELEQDKLAYTHVQNPYDDYAYAFVVLGQGDGKRLAEAPVVSAGYDEVVDQFIDYLVHEKDEYNLHRVGRTYYGDKMDLTSTKNLDFSFPNVVSNKPCMIKTALAGRNFKPAKFEVLVDNQLKASYSIETTSSSSERFGYTKDGWVSSMPLSSTIRVSLKHDALGYNTTSVGYVDYVLVNAWRRLVFSNGQMTFRNPEAVVSGKTYEYRVSGNVQNMQVWDVTDPRTPVAVKGQVNGNVFSFKTTGNSANEFIAYDGTSFCSVKPFGKIENQNLHGERDVDFVILTYSDFMPQAERLKALHNSIDPDLSILVTTPEKVYNEFSCGAKDVTAIRDFCRMLYQDSNPGKRIRYLLLLGDSSYDYKNRNGVVDFVPSFESVSSLSMGTAFVTDDYFGFMDINEGAIDSSIADIGIGRFPVSTLEQAEQMVDKVEAYVKKDASTMGAWRNTVTFFTDDQAEFMRHAERMAAMLKNVGGESIVVDKIYLDAYPQVGAPGGEIAPEVNLAINNRIEKGTLVLNYTGHGGEVQLADEKIMQRKDVDSWRNGPIFPLMITGTCEFSRFDDHLRTSLGEYAFLNQYGGMIAMFTTSRITYGDNNYAFNTGVYNNLFRINGGELYRLGDVYRMAKTTGRDYEKRYVFFGDPALRLAYPKWKVETLSINGQYPGYDLDSIQINDSTWQTFCIYHDTISAMQPVEIKGVVKDLDGEVATGFNGEINVIVYDKEKELSTLGSSDANGKAFDFKLRNSMIFNGKTKVTNGTFTMCFTVPRDIAYRYGQGLINYYATDYEQEANGSCDAFIIGGFHNLLDEDSKSPMVRLFIDDTLFVSGGLTGENPMLLAFIEDESGINTTGAGIGHDIIATLTGPDKKTYCLNDYFVSEVDEPGKGIVTYKLQNLSDGDYTLTLKVWDIFNNSGTGVIDFTVVNSSGMHVENLSNMPNPMTDDTYFVFDHNQMSNNVQVDIYIYDVLGRLVNTLSQRIMGSSSRIMPIRWDGRASNGEHLRNGIYIYRVVATNDLGESDSMVSKLVISK